MQKIKYYLKKVFTPITIMFIPHSNAKSLSLKVPSIGVFISIILWSIGMAYVFSIAIDALEYHKMKEKLDYYSAEFMELKSTISTLKKTEIEFKKLFSLKSKDKILENLDTSDTGSIDMESLKQQIKVTMENVGEIRDYLSQQRDLYLSTPKGWPTDGHITSPYGKRIHPVSGEVEFHGGVDIAADPGMSVRATADGIVSFAGWSGNNGNLVVLEHGFGFSTFFAHNKKILVTVGQKVKRGDILGYVGSTGNSTGPHVHYEVWQKGHSVNPVKYLEGGHNVS
jgi:murein DD-endopeptidase MepM/ murein hydrolase activator NlpD